MAMTKAKMKQFQQLERWKKAALEKANEVRSILGKPPVDHLYKGDPQESHACPITNTIYDDDISRDDILVDTLDNEISLHPGKILKHSMQSRAFVRHFDKGEYPELIEDW